VSLNTTPRTFVTAEIETAAIFNAEVRDALTGIQAAWTAYTASTANITLGTGGTAAGRYLQVGKSIKFWTKVTLGTGGLFTSVPSLSLPVAPAASLTPHFKAVAFDASASAWFEAMSLGLTGSALNNWGVHNSAASSYVQLNAASPMTWAASDYLYVFGVYEAA
jgi:hypothetical protein